MKKSIQMIAVSAAMLAMAACSPERPATTPETLNFTTSINGGSTVDATRAANESWHSGDQIGIYMLAQAGGSILEDASHFNVKYSTTGDGIFTAVVENDAIYINSIAPPVSFIAYYPHTQDITGEYEYPVDISDQTDHTAIDLLYSDNVTSHSAGRHPHLVFHHMLTKVVFDITDLRKDASLEGATVALKGVNTTAVFDLDEGAVSSTDDPGDIAAQTAAEGCEVVAQAIIIPAEDASYIVEVTDASDETTEFTIPSRDYGSGQTHLFELEILDSGEMILVNGDGSIVGWNEVDGGTLTIDKNDDDPAIIANDPAQVAATATSVSVPCTLIGLGTLSATGYSEWITDHSVVGNTITFTLQPNTSTTARSQTVTLTYATASLPVTIGQAGAIVQSPMDAPAPTAGSKTASSISISWSAVTGATGYEVASTTTNAAPTSGWVSATSTSHTFSGLAAATTYYLWVRAVSTNPAYESPSAAGSVSATTEAGGGPVLLFPGADFETTPASMAPLGSTAQQSKFRTITPGVGIDGSSALEWKGANTNNGNGTLFTGFAPVVVTAQTKISFWIKGTSTARGICIAFNGNNSGNIGIVGACGSDTVVSNYASQASYTTPVNTNGQWVKVTLTNIPVTPLTALSFRAGGNADASYDLVIDNVMVE